MRLATKTMLAIEDALQKDQGSSFREHLGNLMPLANDAYSTKEDPWRDHLGASVIGRECARELWYSFRWTTLKKFDGRMLRLFNRGHLEEPRFIAMLLMIGCQVWPTDADGTQIRISGHKGHFGGSLDGVAQGIPDLPDIPVLTEFKTHSEKSFLKLKDDGVMSAKWEHFVQMQMYMGKMTLTWALYAAVNKNTDELHLELVQFDRAQYERYLDRSVKLIEAKEPPPKINESPGWFKCKFCDHADVCHGAGIPARNCRTCVYSQPVDNGKWLCHLKPEPADISSAAQRVGCDAYTLKQKILT